MSADEGEDRRRQQEDVRNEEARNRQRAEIVAAAYELLQPRADHRHLGEDVGADGGGEVRLLIPRQQVTGERHAEHQREEHAAGQPQQLSIALVGAKQDRLADVQQQHDDHRARAVHVKTADEGAGRDLLHDVGDGRVRVIR